MESLYINKMHYGGTPRLLSRYYSRVAKWLTIKSIFQAFGLLNLVNPGDELAWPGARRPGRPGQSWAGWASGALGVDHIARG